MTRAPPALTLFPYTTLFRSPPVAGWRFTVSAIRNGCSDAILGIRVRQDLRRTVRSVVHRGQERGRCNGSSQRIDRKSTRLNSSHVKISYAVFCLKKKKQTSA